MLPQKRQRVDSPVRKAPTAKKQLAQTAKKTDSLVDGTTPNKRQTRGDSRKSSVQKRDASLTTNKSPPKGDVHMQDKEVSDNEDYFDVTLPEQVAHAMASEKARSQRQRNQAAGKPSEVDQVTKSVANFNFH